jgi:hypothetical protein
MQAYSRLRRLAVLAARDSGKSTREVARKFGVSESWVRRVVQQRRELAKLGPYRHRFRDRHNAPLRQRVRYLIREDPRITVKELERVLETKLNIKLLGGVKDELAINHDIRWYGGLDTEFVLSPSGNYLTQPRQFALPWGLEDEIEHLKAGQPPAACYAFSKHGREYHIDTSEYPML